MHKDDMSIFASMLTSIGEIYGKSLSKSLIEIYWRSLQRFALGDLQKAFQAHVDDPDKGQFLPKPADVVRFIEGSGDSRASQAWGKVENAIRDVGSYESVIFDDPLIHAVIDSMGGWVRLCQCQQETLSFRGHDFKKQYQAFLMKPPEHYPEYLSGRMTSQTPVPVGHVKKAQDRIAYQGEEKC